VGKVNHPVPEIKLGCEMTFKEFLHSEIIPHQPGASVYFHIFFVCVTRQSARLWTSSRLCIEPLMAGQYRLMSNHPIVQIP
jgi:hypothetical protein